MTLLNKKTISWLEEFISEQVDAALKLSDKRRKEFKTEFVKEAPGAPSLTSPPNEPAASTAAPAPADGTTPPADPTSPPAPVSGDPAAPADPNAPVDPAASGDPNAPVDPNAPTDDSMDSETDAGGGGGGFGGFGGGGGGGGPGDLGDTEAPPENSNDQSGISPSTEIGDPIESMVSGAQELLAQTNDPNLILKNIKGQIQTVFKQPEHALGLVKALYDTNDVILQSVAQRLYLFIKTSRPI